MGKRLELRKEVGFFKEVFTSTSTSSVNQRLLKTENLFKLYLNDLSVPFRSGIKPELISCTV